MRKQSIPGPSSVGVGTRLVMYVTLHVPLCLIAAEDTFLLLATTEGIHILPYVHPSLTRSSSKVQLLPLPVVGSIQSMTYDPINKSVLFTDSNSFLHR